MILKTQASSYVIICTEEKKFNISLHNEIEVLKAIDSDLDQDILNEDQSQSTAADHNPSELDLSIWIGLNEIIIIIMIKWTQK